MRLPTIEPDRCTFCDAPGPLVTLDRDGWEVCLRCAAAELGRTHEPDYARDMLSPQWGCVPCVACDCVTPVRMMARVEECERHAAGLACLGCAVDEAEEQRDPCAVDIEENWT